MFAQGRNVGQSGSRHNGFEVNWRFEMRWRRRGRDGGEAAENQPALESGLGPDLKWHAALISEVSRIVPDTSLYYRMSID